MCVYLAVCLCLCLNISVCVYLAVCLCLHVQPLTLAEFCVSMFILKHVLVAPSTARDHRSVSGRSEAASLATNVYDGVKVCDSYTVTHSQSNITQQFQISQVGLITATTSTTCVTACLVNCFHRYMCPLSPRLR